MIKRITVLISVMMICVSSTFIATAEKVTIHATAKVIERVGEGFIIEFTINKGSISGSGQLSQQLPTGLTATPLETEKAKFIVEDNTVKFVWLKLPKEKSFNVSYKIQYDENLSGQRSLGGSFSYTDNDKPKSVAFAPVVIDLSSSTYLSTDGNKKVHPEVERKIISLSPEATEYEVELTIHRKVEQTAACFIDQLPTGYRASPSNTQGARFINEDNLAIFSWSKLPDDSVFKVVYAIKAVTKQKVAPVISGILVYGNDAEISMNKLPAKTGAKAKAVDETQALIQEANHLLATLTASNSNTPDMKVIPPSQTIASVRNGTYYKVQIAATKQSPERDEDYFKNTYGITEHVDLVMHHGWKKYFVGTFNDLPSAKKYLTLVKTVITDAYVVAFDHGELIEMRDALLSNSNPPNQ